jgi:6,7-dimethyl-8-ribityllumazine synthase
MSPKRYAFIKANWHAEIVDQALAGFRDQIGDAEIEVFDVPGAFEIPLLARELAASGRFDAVAAAALVVDGGIYRHDFVASAVVEGTSRGRRPRGRPSRSHECGQGSLPE